MPEPVKGSRPPPPGEGKRGEAGHVGYLLRQAAGAHRQRMEKALAPLDLTAAQFSVLTMLDAYPGASGADVARAALLTPQTVNGIIANLERAGSIERRTHESHRRIQRLDLTPAGKATLAKARERVHALDAALVAGFSDQEERAVRSWLAAAARP